MLLLDIGTDWWEEAWKCKLGRSKEVEEKDSMILGFEILKNGIEDAPPFWRN